MKGEGAFAASGTCLVVEGQRHAWFGTGGADHARVFVGGSRSNLERRRDADFGGSSVIGALLLGISRSRQWHCGWRETTKCPTRPAPSPLGRRTVVARGRSPRARPAGYRLAVAYVPGTSQPTAVAVGPTGSDLSTDGGESWSPLGKAGFHAVGFAGPFDAGWGVGDNGLIARFRGSLAAKP